MHLRAPSTTSQTMSPPETIDGWLVKLFSRYEYVARFVSRIFILLLLRKRRFAHGIRRPIMLLSCRNGNCLRLRGRRGFCLRNSHPVPSPILCCHSVSHGLHRADSLRRLYPECRRHLTTSTSTCTRSTILCFLTIGLDSTLSWHMLSDMIFRIEVGGKGVRLIVPFLNLVVGFWLFGSR